MVRFHKVRQQNVDRLKQIAGIPERFMNAHLADFSEAVQGVAKKAVQEHKGLVMLGACGKGKTHLAAALVEHLLLNGVPCLFYSVPELTWRMRAGEISEAPLHETHHLVLDDLGAEYNSGTGWWYESLYRITNIRYNRNLPTTITANADLALDDRIKRRLLAMAIEITM
jgi:DNA replication protein DnaC